MLLIFPLDSAEAGSRVSVQVSVRPPIHVQYNAVWYTSQLKYVFRLEKNESRVVGQNSFTP